VSGWRESEVDQLEAYETPRAKHARRKKMAGTSKLQRYRSDAKFRERVLWRNREWERLKRATDPEWSKRKAAKERARRAEQAKNPELRAKRNAGSLSRYHAAKRRREQS
jgi:hypothetical protein